jgi:hypothetical protein
MCKVLAVVPSVFRIDEAPRYTHGVVLGSHIGVGSIGGARLAQRSEARGGQRRCSVFVSSHGARIHKSHTPSVVRISGMASGTKPG